MKLGGIADIGPLGTEITFQTPFAKRPHGEVWLHPPIDDGRYVIVTRINTHHIMVSILDENDQPVKGQVRWEAHGDPAEDGRITFTTVAPGTIGSAFSFLDEDNLEADEEPTETVIGGDTFVPKGETLFIAFARPFARPPRVFAYVDHPGSKKVAVYGPDDVEAGGFHCTVRSRKNKPKGGVVSWQAIGVLAEDVADSEPDLINLSFPTEAFIEAIEGTTRAEIAAMKPEIEKSVRDSMRRAKADDVPEPEPTPEIGWVIEWGNALSACPVYWRGAKDERTGIFWSTDRNEAVRFARREDAETVAKFAVPNRTCRIAEHQWG